MIIIEGRNVPTGEGVTVRPMTLDDCIEWRSDLVDVSDAEELLDILIAEIKRLNTENREPYKPSWVGDSRGYDQARENPPVVVDGVVISAVRSKDGL